MDAIGGAIRWWCMQLPVVYGSVVGTLVGIFVIMLLKTGLPYVGLQANWQQIITGVVLIVAVSDRYPEREKKCTLITETYRLAYRQSA